MSGVKHIALLVVLLTSITAFGQREKKIFSSSYGRTDSSMVAQQYLNQARLQINSDIDAAFLAIETALGIGIRQNNEDVQAESYFLLGELFAKQEQHDLALGYFGEAQELTSSRKLFWVDIQLARARSLKATGQLVEARSLLADLESRKGNTNRNQRVEINNLMAEILGDIGDISQSNEYLEGNIGLIEQGEISQELESKSNILQGKNKYREDDLEEAERNFSYAWQAAQEVDDPDVRYKLKSEVAQGYADIGEFDKAIDYREQISMDSVALRAGYNGLANELDKGELLLDNNNLEEAILSLNTVVEKLEPLDDKSDLEIQNIKSLAFKNLSQAYLESGDVDNAQTYLDEYTKSLQQLDDERKKKLETNLGYFASLSADVQRMRLLEKDQEITEQRINLLQTQSDLQSEQLLTRNLMIGSLLLLLFGMGVLFIFKQRANRKQQLANRLVELRSLRSQMNPHFIFNALNSVNHYIATNDERKANQYLTGFSTLMRKVLSFSELEFIELDQELELLKLYLELEHERFAEKFDYTVSVDDSVDTGDWKMPPMLIQPFLENAIWHGLRHKESKGTLALNIQVSNNHLTFEVADNGIGRQAAKAIYAQSKKKNKSHGISNTHNRIELVNSLYKTDINLRIDDLPDGGGTVVKLSLPPFE